MPAVRYNVRFTLKERVDERHGVAVVENFLHSLCALGEASGFRIQQDEQESAPAIRPRFLASIEFCDDAAFERAMKNQVERGVHHGAHGKVVDVVSEFKVEILRLDAGDRLPSMPYACEI